MLIRFSVSTAFRYTPHRIVAIYDKYRPTKQAAANISQKGRNAVVDNNDHFSIHAHPSPETSIASKLLASPDSPVAGDSNICKKSQAPLAWCLFENWEQYLEILTKLCHLYNLPMETIGTSICGRDIPMVRLGDGKHKVLYVGTHHGCEWLTGALLLRFIDAYGTAFSTRQRSPA